MRPFATTNATKYLLSMNRRVRTGRYGLLSSHKEDLLHNI